MRHPALLIYAVLSTYIICMFPYHVSGETCPIPHGIKCVEDCRLYDSRYNCQAMTEEGKRLTLHCSPENSLDDSQEPEHSSLYCDIDNEYYWCQVDEAGGGYCEDVKDDKFLYPHHYTSTHGEVCDNTCGKNGNNYFWCSTKKGWDYCSAVENVDYQGYACREDHPCGKHGETYNWCNRKDGGWGYCGPVEAKTLHPNWLDISEAELPHSNTETLGWTDIASYWRTILGGVCQLLVWFIQESAKQGLKKNQWSKRQADDGEIIDTITDKGNCVEFRFIAHQDDRAIADGSSWEREITNIIASWNNSVLRNQAKSELISLGNLRIDLQGLVNRDNQRYYNLQIQVNVRRNNRESTTVAQILIPVEPEIPARHVRIAFLKSFRHRAKVTVKVKRVNQCKNKKNKKAKG